MCAFLGSVREPTDTIPQLACVNASDPQGQGEAGTSQPAPRRPGGSRRTPVRGPALGTALERLLVLGDGPTVQGQEPPLYTARLPEPGRGPGLQSARRSSRASLRELSSSPGTTDAPRMALLRPVAGCQGLELQPHAGKLPFSSGWGGGPGSLAVRLGGEGWRRKAQGSQSIVTWT